MSNRNAMHATYLLYLFHIDSSKVNPSIFATKLFISLAMPNANGGKPCVSILTLPSLFLAESSVLRVDTSLHQLLACIFELLDVLVDGALASLDPCGASLMTPPVALITLPTT